MDGRKASFNSIKLGLGESQVWLDFAEGAELFLGSLVGDRRWNDDILTCLPVDWGNNTLSVTLLQGVDDSQNFGGVSTDRSRVGQNQSDGLLWVNDKDRSDGSNWATGLQGLESVFVNHVVLVRDFLGLVTDDWEGKLLAAQSDFLNVLDPFLVGWDAFGRQTDQLDVSGVEFRLQCSKGTQFSGTDRSEVCWVGEQNTPGVAQVLVEVNLTDGGWSLEVWSGGTNSDSWLGSSVEGDESLSRGLEGGVSEDGSGEHCLSVERGKMRIENKKNARNPKEVRAETSEKAKKRRQLYI